jgi:spoIIIJ-associated protein
MNSVEAEGDTIDAAIAEAIERLRTTRDRVEIEILANATRGLFGIGGRPARVRATLRAPLDVEAAASQSPPPASAQTTAIHPPVSDRPAPAQPTQGVDPASVDRAAKVLEEIIRHVGVSADVTASNDGNEIRLDLSGESSGILIGRRGQMLDALEYLVNRIVGRDENGAPRIVIDTENYRARRRAALEEMARRMASQAKKRRKQVALNPMSPRDRRIVHLILQEDPSLTTRSSGDGYYRKLIIIPQGAGRGPRRER